MTSTPLPIDQLHRRAAEHGLCLRGGLELSADEALYHGETGEPAQVLLLFGNVGSSLWPPFSQSAEYRDGAPHPLDRWSRRIGQVLANEWSGLVLFPFDGPPWLPFGQWAQRAEPLRPSPLGILMHAEFGLWHAYRFAVALPCKPAGFDEWMQARIGRGYAEPSSELPGLAVENRVERENGASSDLSSICERCVEQPCLSACPVEAVSKGQLDVSRCLHYLNEPRTESCLEQGCRARNACPVATSMRYCPAHRAFHMREFRLGLNRRLNEQA